MRIDIHNHVIPESVLRLLRSDHVYGMRVSGGYLTGCSHAEFPLVPSFFDPQAKLAALARCGLHAAVVSLAPPLFGYDLPTDAAQVLCEVANAGLAEFCEYDPGHLRWLAHVPLSSPTHTPTALKRAADSGCVGVQIATSVDGRRLDNASLAPFWHAVAAIGLPVMVHPAYNESHRGLGDYYLQNTIGNLVETTIAIERLICTGTLDRHPGLRLVLVHGGGFFPYQAGRLRHARTVRPELKDAPADPWAYIGQITFDSITHDIAALGYLISRVGVDHVCVGTDLPFDMGVKDPIAQLAEAVDEEIVNRVAEENPSRLFGFPR